MIMEMLQILSKQNRFENYTLIGPSRCPTVSITQLCQMYIFQLFTVLECYCFFFLFFFFFLTQCFCSTDNLHFNPQCIICTSEGLCTRVLESTGLQIPTTTKIRQRYTGETYGVESQRHSRRACTRVELEKKIMKLFSSGCSHFRCQLKRYGCTLVVFIE